MLKVIFISLGVMLLGALGALLFTFFLLPQLITNPYFDQFQFVHDFKAGKIIINPKETTYIQESFAIEGAIERVKKSIVAIQSTALGVRPGLVATADGNIVALANAIPASASFSVFLDSNVLQTTVVKRDVKNNLALLKADATNLSTVGFTSEDKIKLGQKVFFLLPVAVDGFDAAESAEQGWLANEGNIRQISKDAIKTNISDSQNTNGAPAFNLAGELVGLAYKDTDGTVSIIPISKIKEFLGL